MAAPCEVARGILPRILGRQKGQLAITTTLSDLEAGHHRPSYRKTSQVVRGSARCLLWVDFVDLVGQQWGWRCPLLAEAEVFVAAPGMSRVAWAFRALFGSFRAVCLTLVGELEADLV